MKWNEIDLEACLNHLRSGKQVPFLDMKKDIMNRYAKGVALSLKQQNVIKRMYIVEVLDVDIFMDDQLNQLTFKEIQRRLADKD